MAKRRRLLFDTRDIQDASEEMMQDISGAVLGAAYKVRNDARDIFSSSKSLYKHSTGRYNPLKEGLMVGKLKDVQGDASVKVHSFGTGKSGDSTWKTRFFTGGTKYRKTNSGHGDYGYIQENKALVSSVQANSGTLDQFITKIL